MSSNLSSGFNDSLTDLSSSDSILFICMACLISNPTNIYYTTFKSIRAGLILPLCILILHYGLHQWKRRLSTSSPSSMSHSDCFTYNMVLVELIVDLGYIVSFIGIYRNIPDMLTISVHILLFVWYGELCFHILTCLERYLAVVHPITYRNLRNERGIRFRNTIIAFVWLLCIIGTGFASVDGFQVVLSYFLLISSLMIASFCTISVLFVLHRPGPGKHGAKREKVDPSKQRAFQTLAAVLTVLLLRFIWDVYWLQLFIKGETSDCVLTVSGVWFTLPCSLVLPLLFLHRAGKLVCCKMPCVSKG